LIYTVIGHNVTTVLRLVKVSALEETKMMSAVTVAAVVAGILAIAAPAVCFVVDLGFKILGG
jgi:hypothetical protein